MRKLILSGFCFGLLNLATMADPRSGPARQTLLERPWGTVYCAEKCTVTPDRTGKRFTVSSPDGPMAVLIQEPWIVVQARDGSILRVRSQETSRGEEILVQINKVNYRVFRRFGEVEWKFPDDHIYFKTLDGNLRSVLGSKGSLSIHRNFTRKTYIVENDEGSSEYDLQTAKMGKGSHRRISYKLKVCKGEPPSKYPYLLRGVAFDLGSVGLYLPVTTGKFSNALDWSQVQSYRGSIAPATAVKPAEAPTAPAASNDDPMNLRFKHPKIEFKAADPLKANTNPAGEELFKIKSIDPSAPQPQSAP